MNSNKDSKSIEYFENFLYPEDLILNPPNHVQLELNKVIESLGSIDTDIADFGAGTGRLTIPLLKSGRQVIAVDTTPEAVIKLNETAVKVGRSESLTTSEKLSSDHQAIVGCDVLHHLDLQKFIGVFYNSLANNGVIVFSEPNTFNIFWYFLIFIYLDWSEEKGILRCNHFYLRSILKKNGFTDITIEGLGLFPLPFFNKYPLLRKWNIFLGNLPILRIFAYRLIVKAKKSIDS